MNRATPSDSQHLGHEQRGVEPQYLVLKSRQVARVKRRKGWCLRQRVLAARHSTFGAPTVEYRATITGKHGKPAGSNLQEGNGILVKEFLKEFLKGPPRVEKSHICRHHTWNGGGHRVGVPIVDVVPCESAPIAHAAAVPELRVSVRIQASTSINGALFSVHMLSKNTRQ